ncbi:MAG: amino acid ABC transporter ATP-binding protein [Kofleriaceae bacterium]
MPQYLESFDEGEVEIAGMKLVPGMVGREAAKLRALRVRVGMVFQQFNLFPHLTAMGNITLAPRIVRRATPAVAEAKARALLEQVGLADRAGAYPHELSGGQQQRIAIARALAQEPDVMLFDEPTSALDPEMRDDVMRVIRDLAAGGMTMLVVTHEMQFAHDIATRVWVIDAGTIVEDGPPSQVVDAPVTAVAREFFSRLRR